MATVKFEKDSLEWKMLNDFWLLMQNYYLPEDSDDYWESEIHDTDEFMKAYKDHPMARRLAISLHNYLEEKHKAMKADNKI